MSHDANTLSLECNLLAPFFRLYTLVSGTAAKVQFKGFTV